MFSSHSRGQQQQQQRRHQHEPANRSNQDAYQDKHGEMADSSTTRRASWRQQFARMPLNQTSAQSDDNYRDQESEDRHEDQDRDWRQAALMLTERDETRLLASHDDDDDDHNDSRRRRSPRFGRDTTDAAPTNRRRHEQKRLSSRSPQPPAAAAAATSQQFQNRNKSPPPATQATSVKLAKSGVGSGVGGGSTSLFTSHKRLPASDKQQVYRQDNENENDDDGDDEQFNVYRNLIDGDEHYNDHDHHDHDDDNSSISFAQSGCHSILSAWRTKAANRAARALAPKRPRQPRPTSVLSNSSSVGKRSSASTAYTLASRLTSGKSNAGQHKHEQQGGRIPLGPKSAQHFVTNSRRRRRANELILSTLEARRRAISLNRQNLFAGGGGGGSFFGSDLYLLGCVGGEQELTSTSSATQQQHVLRGATPDDYQRLSLSPASPVLRLSANRSPSPLQSANNFAKQATTAARLRSPSGALSDLGARQNINNNNHNNHSATNSKQLQQVRLKTAAAAAAAAFMTQQQRPKSLSHSSLVIKQQVRAPPLAKLDQNSSDLCSSNESSSGKSSSSSSNSSLSTASSSSSTSSSGSRFTQLVTSELAPDCATLLDEHAHKLRLAANSRAPLPRLARLPPTTSGAPSFVATRTHPTITDDEMFKRQQQQQQQQQLLQAPASQSQSNRSKPQIRITRRKHHSNRKQEDKSNGASQREQQQQDLIERNLQPATSVRDRLISSDDDDDDNDDRVDAASKPSGQFRRGADLKRDSVRRLRMSRQQATTTTTRPASVTGGSGSSTQTTAIKSSQSKRRPDSTNGANSTKPTSASTTKSAVKIQPLSKSRRLEIENNPFLNRNQFRTMSLRSQISNQSRAANNSSSGASGSTSASTETNRVPAIKSSKQRWTLLEATQEAHRIERDNNTKQQQQQQQQQQKQQVRQVEQMLRQMKPNQVIESHLRDNVTSSASIMQTETKLSSDISSSDAGRRHQAAAAAARGATSPHRSSLDPDPLQTGRAIFGASTRPPFESTRLQGQMIEDERPLAGDTTARATRTTAPFLNEFRTTTRLVREGAKSSDDLTFDLQGNRRQSKLDERWRQERIVEQSPLGAHPKQREQQTTLMTTSSSQLISNQTLRNSASISPPAEFSDNNTTTGSSMSPERGRRQQQQQQQWSNQTTKRPSEARREAPPRSLVGMASRVGGSAISDTPVRAQVSQLLAPAPTPTPPPPRPPLPIDRSFSDGRPSKPPTRPKPSEERQSRVTVASTAATGASFDQQREQPSRLLSAQSQFDSSITPSNSNMFESKPIASYSGGSTVTTSNGKPVLASRATLASQQAQALASSRNRNRSLEQSATETPSVAKPVLQPLDSVQILQASLPKFERTADDEFRKRVDQLRQLARANLSADQKLAHHHHQQQQQPRQSGSSSSAKGSTMADSNKPLPTARPLSLNWNGQASTPESGSGSGGGGGGGSNSNRTLSSLKSIDELAPISAESFHAKSAQKIAPKSSAGQSGQNQQQQVPLKRSETLACTNLDDMLLADRYQKPMPTTWRRSNSSLASLSSGGQLQQQQQQQQQRSAQNRVQQRPISPTNFGLPRQSSSSGNNGNSGGGGGGSVLSELSVMSAEPRPPANASELVPMRVVVQEKSAPTRNFAFVEQRSSIVQRLKQRESPSPPPRPSAGHSTLIANQLKPLTPVSSQHQQQHQQQQQQQRSQLPAQRLSEASSTSASHTPATGSESNLLRHQLPPALAPPPQAAQSQAARQLLVQRTRLSSPRSPEFGQAANSSSNDDSAIASSVSSPSLSFMMNSSSNNNNNNNSGGAVSQPLSTAAAAAAAVTGTYRGSSSSPQSSPSKAQLPGLRAPPPMVSANESSACSSTGQQHQRSSNAFAPAPRSQSSGALQSILRRQQQQQQQLKHEPEWGDRRDNVDVSSETRASGIGHSLLSPFAHSQTTLIETTTSSTTSTTASFSQQKQQQATTTKPAGVDTLTKSKAISQRQQQQQTESPMVPKRVHFNDRTSVRSFESLSSETDSNTTAINRDQMISSELISAQQQHHQQQQRLLIGSPDSIGSGSTSRLSCESPDFRRQSDGAAIYAIRGDPELEHQTVGARSSQPMQPMQAMQQQQQQQQHSLQAARTMLAANSSHAAAHQLFQATNNMPNTPGQQQHSRQIVSAPRQLMHYDNQQVSSNIAQQHPVSVSIAQQQFNQRQQQQQQQRQQQQQYGSPAAQQSSIRMTAPPVIGAGQSLKQVQQSPMQQRQAQPYTGQHQAQQQSLISMRSPQVLPAHRPMIDLAAVSTLAPPGQPRALPSQRAMSLEDEDDPDYAFRLRQAATSRAFSFAQQQQQQQQQQLQSLSATSAAGGGGGQVQRRQPVDMTNFQTEV